MLNQKIYYSYKKKRRVNNFIMLKIASYSIKDKFYLVRGKDVREINIAEAYEAIGPESASAILGFKICLEAFSWQQHRYKACIYRIV